MVRNTEGLNELIERTRDIPMSPERLRAQRSSFAFGNLNIENPNVTPEVIARADADFDRIFGSDCLNVGEIAEQRLGRTS
jgi:hypothetical protein